MDFSRFTNRIVGAQTEARWLRWIALGLLGANIVLAVGVFQTRTVVTIQPPGMSEAAQIAENHANAAYKKAWGLFIANLLGNVKPGSADFVIATLTPLLAPDLYRPVVDAIQDQALKINRAKVATSFIAQEILYNPQNDRVYVAGRQTSSGPGSDPVTRERTYELVLSIEDYKPMITALDVYADSPRLEE
ncbi:TraE/TraK family type IV conjugative transfer system protein [Modicisalibacter sp. MOD 31.J]|uniref:TraE/TraK family type IV conjugative transfer system protein n=1 Tax=Modicisalibacter sp. MOD 31.J TaxID=2831897 RepID=UPI001CCFDAF8|nr:TraE/TraK family type IV conjugative transfer system protein [Modicisalibacter sp. MOD 31.J]MBZ9574494.1 hypothetical protein [Modicisalibacter sp. MOD 31.J]